jgi:hypothetical protein
MSLSVKKVALSLIILIALLFVAIQVVDARPTDGLPLNFVNGHAPALNASYFNNLDASINDLGINIENYGAIPNDANDDTAAIQKALDAGYGTVIVPNGTFLCSGPLYPHTNQVIEGKGWNSILKIKTQGDWNLIESGTGNSYSPQNWTVKNLAIDLNYAATSNPTSHIYGAGISYSYSTCLIDHVYIHNAWQRCTQGYGVNSVTIRDSRFENFQHGGTDVAAINIDYGDYSPVDKPSQFCIVTGNRIVNGNQYGAAIELDGTTGIGGSHIIANNIIENCYEGVVATINSHGIIISDNVIKAGSYPIQIGGSYCNVHDNVIEPPGDCGITISGDYNNIHDNIIIGRISTAPIWVQSTGQYNTIQNNHLYGGDRGIQIDGDNNYLIGNSVLFVTHPGITLSGDNNLVSENNLEIPADYGQHPSSGAAAGSYTLFMPTTTNLVPGANVEIVEAGKSTQYTQIIEVATDYIILKNPLDVDHTTSAWVDYSPTLAWMSGILINSGADSNSILNNRINVITDPLLYNGASNTIKGNSGYLSENTGTAIVANGATYIDVAHGLSITPAASRIIVTPTNNMGSAAKFWVSNIGATTFRINVDADPGAGTATFSWSVV